MANQQRESPSNYPAARFVCVLGPSCFFSFADVKGVTTSTTSFSKETKKLHFDTARHRRHPAVKWNWSHRHLFCLSIVVVVP